MAVALVRKPIPVSVHDADAVRAWLKERIQLEIKLKGQPVPKFLLLADGYEEVLDLTAALQDDEAASLGATFQRLKERPNIERQFALMRATLTDAEGQERTHALLFEEVDALDEPRRWWVSMLEFRTDADTELGHILGDWQDSAFETSDPNDLWPFLRELAVPPAGARPARVLSPRTAQPDIQVATGAFPPNVPAPTTPKMMVELTAQLAVNDLLTGAVKGTVVVRYAARAWEMWVLGGDMPADLEDMVRYIANRSSPPAEAVGVAMIAIRPNEDPPVPSVQVVAELGGAFVETWAPLDFPAGPAGPKRIREIRWWDARPVPERGMWLGVDPMVLFELGPLGADA